MIILKATEAHSPAEPPVHPCLLNRHLQCPPAARLLPLWHHESANQLGVGVRDGQTVPRGRPTLVDERDYERDALRMVSIESLSVASNSSSLWCTDSPSVSAREKLAITPWLAARRTSASLRL
jgi:hypothetical protein